MVQNQVRIIAGKWRGRKIYFPTLPGLRPTPDRIKETLFNWLAPTIRGARCLDLFCGSGALGIEALSRGAEEVVFVDQDPIVVKQLSEFLQNLGAQRANVHQQTAQRFLSQPAQSFDVVFLDPPFQQGLINPILEILIQHDWLNKQGLIYIEMEDRHENLEIPEPWHLYRHKKSGNVAYGLCRIKS